MLRRWWPGIIAVGLFFTAAPAWADDSFFGRTNCSDSSQPGCEVVVESEQTIPGAPNTPGAGGNGNGGATATATAPVEAECEDGMFTALCSATVSAGSASPGGDADEGGVDLTTLAHSARASFDLPSPDISMSPSASAPVLVQVPVWLWIEADQWQEQEATATVPGGSVTVTATPATAQWSMGDGSTVTCQGPGTAYDAARHDPASASPDCGHTYTSTGNDREVSVSITWSVSWSGSDGEGGGLDDCFVPGVMEALKPGKDESHASTEEVPA